MFAFRVCSDLQRRLGCYFGPFGTCYCSLDNVHRLRLACLGFYAATALLELVPNILGSCSGSRVCIGCFSFPGLQAMGCCCDIVGNDGGCRCSVLQSIDWVKFQVCMRYHLSRFWNFLPSYPLSRD